MSAEYGQVASEASSAGRTARLGVLPSVPPAQSEGTDAATDDRQPGDGPDRLGEDRRRARGAGPGPTGRGPAPPRRTPRRTVSQGPRSGSRSGDRPSHRLRTRSRASRRRPPMARARLRPTDRRSGRFPGQVSNRRPASPAFRSPPESTTAGGVPVAGGVGVALVGGVGVTIGVGVGRGVGVDSRPGGSAAAAASGSRSARGGRRRDRGRRRRRCRRRCGQERERDDHAQLGGIVERVLAVLRAKGIRRPGVGPGQGRRDGDRSGHAGSRMAGWQTIATARRLDRDRRQAGFRGLPGRAGRAVGHLRRADRERGRDGDPDAAEVLQPVGAAEVPERRLDRRRLEGLDRGRGQRDRPGRGGCPAGSRADAGDRPAARRS